MHAPRETCSDINELQIASQDNLSIAEISLFLSIINISTFQNQSFNENVLAIGIPVKED